MHERGWLKGVGRVLVAQVVRGQAAELVVDDGDQPIDRRGIAVLEIEQQPCDLGRRVHLSLLVRVAGSVARCAAARRRVSAWPGCSDWSDRDRFNHLPAPVGAVRATPGGWQPRNVRGGLSSSSKGNVMKNIFVKAILIGSIIHVTAVTTTAPGPGGTALPRKAQASQSRHPGAATGRRTGSLRLQPPGCGFFRSSCRRSIQARGSSSSAASARRSSDASSR